MVFRQILIAFLFLLLNMGMFGHTFNGRIEGYNLKTLNICTQFGDESRLLETISTNFGGEFLYNFDAEETGLYRIYFDNNDFFDIIYNNEDIEIVTKFANPQYNMTVLKSKENEQFYSYIISNYEYDYKIEVLKQLLNVYPHGEFYKKAEKELNMEVDNRNKNLTDIIKMDPNSFAGRYISYFKEVVAPVKYNDAQKKEYVKTTYLSNFRFDDVEMLNSDAYNHIVLNYLKLNSNNDPVLYYESAVRVMNNLSTADPRISKFILEYILTGFEIMGIDEEAAKLSLDFGDICSDSDDDYSLMMRIKSNTQLKVGSKAPDISSKTVSGKEFTLSNMKSGYTLVIFWATWCEHCRNFMPRLSKDMSLFKQANMDIVSVSVDNDKTVLHSFLKENPFPWETICDYKGWDGEIVDKYAIYATPMMFIIDKDMKIVSKPTNENRLYIEIEKLLNK